MKTIIVKILGKEYMARGETMQEALARLEYKGFARVKSTLTGMKDEKSKSIFLGPFQTNRLFSLNPNIKAVAIKQLAMRLE